MKKPIWMRLLGWVVVLAWGMAAFCLWGALGPRHDILLLYPAYMLAIGGVMLFFLWAVCSAIVWAANRQARTSAAVMRGSMAGLTPPPAPHVRAGQGDGLPRWAGKSAVTSCYHCPAPAVLHCCRHEANLCWQHLLTHDSDECTYIRAERVVRQDGGAAEAPRRTATSPIGGIR
ncbi:MAG: hypothetical protein ACRD2G_08505 [Terriglobia bacterium]